MEANTMETSKPNMLLGFAGPRDAGRYDRLTIALHWATALLVVILFSMALTMENLPKGTALRHNLQLLHISLGLVLSIVVLVRMIWATTGARVLPRPTSPWRYFIARSVHYALYTLLAMQIVLGFLFRWAQGEEFTFFGMFTIPAMLPKNPTMKPLYDNLHYYVAWTIIVLAACHAVAALLHHHVLRDGILRRMLPMKIRDNV